MVKFKLKKVNNLAIELYNTGKRSGFLDGIMSAGDITPTDSMTKKEFNKYLSERKKLFNNYKKKLLEE